jgi:hypothetical protein
MVSAGIELPCSQNRHIGQDLSHGIEGFVLKSVLLFMLTIFVAAMGVAMGMSGSQTKTVQLPEGGPTRRPSISSMPGTGRNYRKPIQQLHNEDRGLAEMLLDSFHIPRVLPPQLAALVVLLKMQAAESRRGTRENEPPLAA